MIAEHVDRGVGAQRVADAAGLHRIPCVSQAFDPDWKAHGHQDAATEMIRTWCAARNIAASRWR